MVLSIHVSEWGKRSNMDKKKLHDSDFDLTNLPLEAQDPEIKAEDFVLESNEHKSFEQKFQTKPTTFLKDSLRRFSKNKSSVVAAYILGGLLLLSIFVPIIDRNDTSVTHPEITYLRPKLFNAGTGFWDGTKKFADIPVDFSSDPEGNDKEANWWPNPDVFVSNAVSKKSFSDLTYTNNATKYGKNGYIAVGYDEKLSDEIEYVEYKTNNLKYALNINVNHYLTSLDVYDSDKISKIDDTAILPTSINAQSALYFNYTDDDNNAQSIELIAYSKTHNINSDVSSLKEDQINLSNLIKAEMDKQGSSQTSFAAASFSLRVKNEKNHAITNTYVRKIEFLTEETNAEFKKAFEAPSFNDASECFLRESRIDSMPNPAYWSLRDGTKQTVLAKMYFCSFVYDPYEEKLGIKTDNSFPFSTLDTYRRQRWIDWKCVTKKNPDTGEFEVDASTFKCEIIDKDKCPLVEPVKIEDIVVDYDGTISFVKATIYQYKVLGYSRMPIFLFGTDKSGRDMLKYVFEGLRTSLILGIVTTVVCFIIGLIYGSGYFGGTVDLVMERITDILSGVPWIVVMTLVIIHLGSNILTFALALCLTGWIGTAAITRTQFYRFRGREYVLASRTLGANDARLIAKHILPNAMGTIITSAVLMVPSVIFSEATISYLGLGLKNLASLGVILSYNQAELQTNPYLLIFPAVIIALIMISFNLFGNGLRDAVNPSLKGEDE